MGRSSSSSSSDGSLSSGARERKEKKAKKKALKKALKKEKKAAKKAKKASKKEKKSKKRARRQLERRRRAREARASTAALAPPRVYVSDKDRTWRRERGRDGGPWTGAGRRCRRTSAATTSPRRLRATTLAAEALVAERAKCRSDREYRRADELRDELRRVHKAEVSEAVLAQRKRNADRFGGDALAPRLAKTGSRSSRVRRAGGLRAAGVVDACGLGAGARAGPVGGRAPLSGSAKREKQELLRADGR
ncbi:hypothetical protein JL722_12942 [Aureococcus anophagefferens]|nr:hypothetical protein JL722_12942 [Aureococcus anophagefferens]